MSRTRPTRSSSSEAATARSSHCPWRPATPTCSTNSGSWTSLVLRWRSWPRSSTPKLSRSSTRPRPARPRGGRGSRTDGRGSHPGRRAGPLHAADRQRLRCLGGRSGAPALVGQLDPATPAHEVEEYRKVPEWVRARGYAITIGHDRPAELEALSTRIAARDPEVSPLALRDVIRDLASCYNPERLIEDGSYDLRSRLRSSSADGEVAFSAHMWGPPGAYQSTDRSPRGPVLGDHRLSDRSHREITTLVPVTMAQARADDRRRISSQWPARAAVT